MLKVLIVDDEVIVRVGMKSVIDWNKYGFELIGEASNGQMALEIIKANRPHVVITDLRMPLMDGIELIKSVREDGLDTRFIVLSCHDEFKLVREAMKLGAEEYLLKLNMEPEELIKVLVELKGKIQEDKQQKEKRYIAEKNVTENLPVLRERFFQELVVDAPYKGQEITDKMRFLNIQLEERNLICLVIKIDNNYKYENQSEKDKQLINYAVINIVTEILDDFKPGYVFGTKPGEFSIILSVNSTRSELERQEKLQVLAGKVRELLKNYIGISVSTGVSLPHFHWSDLKQAYKEAVEAVSHRYFRGSGSITFYRALDTALKIKQVQEDLELKVIDKCIKELDSQGFHENMDKVLNKIKDCCFNQEAAQVACTRMVVRFINYLRDSGEVVEEYLPPYYNPGKDVLRLETIEDVCSWILWFENCVVSYINHKCENSYKKIITDAIAYIKQNYNKNLSLTDTAKHIQVSSSYLSSLFSQETGKCFTDYLTEVRIEKAKEYIERTNMKMYEIAESVGFQNIYYFSKIFKKVTGKTPMEFKDKKIL
jgi:two-component system, response regulator YesN